MQREKRLSLLNRIEGETALKHRGPLVQFSLIPADDGPYEREAADEVLKQALQLSSEHEPASPDLLLIDMHFEADVPPQLQLAISALFGAGVTLLSKWLDGRNGRKLKVKFDPLGNVEEMEVSGSMSEEEFLKFLERVQNRAEERRLRKSLIQPGEGQGRPEAH